MLVLTGLAFGIRMIALTFMSVTDESRFEQPAEAAGAGSTRSF